jgi:hypothetical protein
MSVEALASLIAELPEGVVVTDPDIVASYRQDRALTRLRARRWPSFGPGAPKRCKR